MKLEFEFCGKKYSLEMDGRAEGADGFYHINGRLLADGQQRDGVFRLTKLALDTARAEAEHGRRAEEELLLAGCREALRAELFIRPIGAGFNFVVDHRFFEPLPS